MWLRHFAGFLWTFLSYFFTAIGTTLFGAVLGVVCACLAAIFSLRRIHRQQGQDAMLKHWEENTKAAAKVSLVCALCIYGPLAAFKLGQAVYDDHIGLVTRSQTQRQRIATLQTSHDEQLDSCVSELKATKGTLLDKNSLVDSLQQGMVALQGPQAQQALNIGSCISSLAKMEPQVREQTNVWSVVTEVLDPTTGMPVPSYHSRKRFYFALIIATNEEETRFRGIVSCQAPFDAALQPILFSDKHLPSGGGLTDIAPVEVGTSAYKVSASLGERLWNPLHPVVLLVSGPFDDLGPCKFVPE